MISLTHVNQMPTLNYKIKKKKKNKIKRTKIVKFQKRKPGLLEHK